MRAAGNQADEIGALAVSAGDLPRKQAVITLEQEVFDATTAWAVEEFGER